MPAKVQEQELRELAELYEHCTSIKAVKQASGRSQRVIQRAIATYGTHRPGKAGRNSTDLFKALDGTSAYWLGFIAADGHIRYQPESHRYELVIEINRRDEEHLDRFKAFVGFGSKFYRSRDECVIYSFSSKQLVDNLMFWLNPNNKTHLNNFDKVQEPWKKDFVRGYFDGDGHMAKSSFSITSCLGTLSPLVRYINECVGEDARLYPKKGQLAWSARWNKSATLRFKEIFNGNIRLERKW